MRAPVVRAPLERIRRGRQPTISAVEAELDVHVAIGLAAQAIDTAGELPDPLAGRPDNHLVPP